MLSFPRQVYELVTTSPVKLLVFAFLLILMLFPQDGGGNKDARLATLAALTLDHSFAITNYPWTQDWAISPMNGQMYANKPPGPVILGAPVYFLIDRMALLAPLSGQARQMQLYLDRNIYSHVLSLLLQAIPYACMTLLIVRWLTWQRISGLAIQFGGLALLFGTTAVLFMNSYFGHGMAALFVLAATYCLLRRYYALAGFLLGWAALSDYGAALITVPFIVSLVIQARREGVGKALGWFIAGAFVPAVVWCIYHWTLFGHPLAIASRFSNPIFVEVSPQYSVWGLFSTTLNVDFLRELLIGSQRGLLFTQPWVLVISLLSGIALVRKQHVHKDFLSLAVLALGGLMVLLFFNSSFNGWYAGWTSGPRYLSSILPVFGILASLLYPTLSLLMRRVLWLTLLVPLALFVVVYATTILAPPEPLWLFYGNLLSQARTIRPVVNVITAGLILTGLTLISLAGRLGPLISSERIPQTHHPRSRGR